MRRGNALVGLKHVGNAGFLVYIYDASFSYDTFNAPIDALPLQIGVGVSIVVSFTFSPSLMTFTIFPVLCFYKLSFQRSHQRLLTLQRILIFW